MVAVEAMAATQVNSVAPSGIGSRLSNERTKARTPSQVTPGVQPDGRKLKLVASLLISGFTAQSGRPSAVTSTAALGSKVMSTWVATTTSPPVTSVTSNPTRPFGAPVADPMSMTAAGATVCVAVAVTVAVAVAVAVGARVAVGVGVGVPVGVGEASVTTIAPLTPGPVGTGVPSGALSTMPDTVNG